MTTWGGRWLKADAVASLLDIQTASLYQLVARQAFPQGEPMGRERRWRLDVVLQFILANRRHLRQRVPRLFARTVPIPALFCGAYSFAVDRQFDVPHTMVAYVWQPSDAGGKVALAYPLDHTTRLPQTADVLSALRAEIYGVKAVVVPQGPSGVGANGVITPPPVDYADTREPAMPVHDVSWFDLAYLLQSDLPWWPPGLRHSRSMLMWHPNSPTAAVVPTASSIGDPYTLLRLGATVHPDGARQACSLFFQKFAERAAFTIYPPTDSEPQASLGIAIGARAVAPGTGDALGVEVGGSRTSPSPSQTAMVLHSRVDPAAVDHELIQCALRVDAWSPLIDRVAAIPVDTANPVERQFLRRLRQSPSPIDELGFLIVAAHGSCLERIKDPLSNARPLRLEHEAEPDVWVARYGDTFYTSVPRASSVAAQDVQQLATTQDQSHGGGELR